jgi:CTP:molybdopterin cytidylyltransferase MocA
MEQRHMSHEQAIGVVVLAGGAAVRYGAPKQVLEFEGQPLVRRAALAALAVGATTVVTGAHRQAVESALAGLPVSLAFNDGWERGMGSSIACGVRAISAHAPEISALILMLADQPLIGSAQLAELVVAHAQAPDGIIAARHAQVSGPPCLFPRAYFEALSRLSGANGARSLLDEHHDAVETIPMPGCAIDIDTPQDYASAIAAAAACADSASGVAIDEIERIRQR